MKLSDVLTITTGDLFSRRSHWVAVASVETLDSDEKFLLLSNDEKQRAGSFKSKNDRARFIIAHALKRYLLSQIINIDPSSLCFSSSDKGKPFCDDDKTLDFNISHSAEWVVFGVSSIAAIGVDVERADRVIGKKTVAYALTEQQVLTLVGAADTVEKKMLYWTQKEAVSKALGVGISVGFKNIQCSGELGTSLAECNEQQFLMQSYRIGNAVLSIATLTEAAVEVYQLVSWPTSDTDAIQADGEGVGLQAGRATGKKLTRLKNSHALLLEKLL
jgi:4'-phosphopantetheinyl transferase